MSLQGLACGVSLPLLTTLVAVTLLGAPPDLPTCRGPLTRDDVVACALAGHPGVRAAEYGREAAMGRKHSARTLLPSNPTVEVTVAQRVGMRAPDRDVNVYGRLSQEIEIGGQRRKRIAVADAGLVQAQARIELTRRDIAADALRAFFEVLAAQEQRAMIGRIARSNETLVELARSSEAAGLGSALTADVAVAASVRVQRQQVEADRRVATASATLTGLIGNDPAVGGVTVRGELTPLTLPADLAALVDAALLRRAEIELARAEREVFLKQVELYRRSRVPNPSVVLYGQRDGFAERVLGGGIALPIPLPSPLGRSFAGQIAEHKALARQAEAEVLLWQRTVRTEVAVGFQELLARRAELALFEGDRLQRAEAHLEALGQEMASGRISIREAVILQQTFLEYIATHIEARRALALASVELARVAGLLPEASQP